MRRFHQLDRKPRDLTNDLTNRDPRLGLHRPTLPKNILIYVGYRYLAIASPHVMGFPILET